MHPPHPPRHQRTNHSYPEKTKRRVQKRFIHQESKRDFRQFSTRSSKQTMSKLVLVPRHDLNGVSALLIFFSFSVLFIRCRNLTSMTLVSNLSYRQAQWLTVLLIITLGLTLFNAVLLIFPNTSPSSNSHSVVVDDEEPLPTPDAYIGLRKMLRLEGWKESLQPFYNFPFEVALVDKTRPNDVISNGRTIAHVNKTVIVPDNRHVVVNNDVSTSSIART